MAKTAWRSRIVGSGEEAPDQLLANPRNWRIHPKAQQDALAGVLSEVGWVQNVIVNRRTGFVIDGHARVEIAISRNEPSVPVVYVDLDENEEGIVLAALDPLAALAGTDNEKRADLLAELAINDAALLAFLKPEPAAGLTDPDDVPEAPEPTTKPGDLWLLGEHRLLCGDSTKAEDVARLMDGAKAAAVVTDPPYGVSVVKRGMVGADFGVAAKGRYAPVAGDDVTPDVRYLLDLAPNAIIWGGNYFADQLTPSGSWLIWDKRVDSGIGNTFADAELAWSNVGGPARVHRQLWNGMIREGEHGKREHPTQKPVALMEWCVGKTTGAILDPFLGSGTTLIACERLGRRCYAMQIEPRYVDVAVKRWEQFTGRSAVLESAASTSGTTRGRSTGSPRTRASTGKTKASAK